MRQIDKCFVLALLCCAIGCGTPTPTPDTSSVDYQTPPACTPTGCNFFCDPFTGSCAECLVSAQCGADFDCLDGLCVEGQSCIAHASCGERICDMDQGQCVSCLVDAQCPADHFCVKNDCVGPTKTCALDEECPVGLLCSEQYGLCTTCRSANECSQGERCGPGGICIPADCTIDQSRCEGDKVAHCGPNGTFLPAQSCPDGQICSGGSCTDMICEPGVTHCEDLKLQTCNSLGNGVAESECSPGMYCPDYDTKCSPIKHRTLIIFGTSGSMNEYPNSSTTLDQCLDEDKPCPAAWPVCETGQTPLSVLGHTKVALREVLEEPSIPAHLSVALMRFPQAVMVEPNCTNGHYLGTETILNDADFHVAPTSSSGWFQRGLAQVLSVPFTNPTNGIASVTQWIDFSEHITSTGQACLTDSDCGYGYCDGTCQEHYDPELRGTGYSSIGRTLFYASEYLRQNVVLQGRPCLSHDECPVQGYRCGVNGSCEDKAAHCREIRIVVIVNGAEAVNLDTKDFFHPWIQAKRLSYGLGCQNNDDCLNNSQCKDGVCELQDLPSSGFVCSGTGQSCTPNTDDDAEASVCGGEPGHCTSIHLDYVEEDTQNLLIASNGAPIKAQVHVVDLKGDTLHNQWLTTYGNGQHHVVDALTVEAIKNQIRAALTVEASQTCTANK